MYTIQHNPARLYNLDETGITIVQHKHRKILGLKGNRQISSVQFAERGSLVTQVNSVSPTGQFLPTVLVYPRKYMKPELIHHTPLGSIHACHSPGWTESEIFTQWFLHFVKYKVSQEECARLRESVPYIKVYRYNPKHLYPNLNGYGDNGQRKVRSSCGSTYCTFSADALHVLCACR